MSVYSCHLKTINFLYFREKHLWFLNTLLCW
jgi:hypothetical protein